MDNLNASSQKETRHYSQRILLNLFFLLTLAIIVIINISAFFQVAKFDAANQLVIRTYQTSQLTHNILLNMLDIESLVRGYLIVSDPSFINKENLNEKINQLYANLDQAMKLPLTPVQQQKLYSLIPLFEEKLTLTKKTILLKEQHKMQTKTAVLLISQSHNISKKIRSILLDINDKEFILLAERNENALYNLHQANLFILSASTITLLIIFLSLLALNRQLSHQLAAEKAAFIANEKLKFASIRDSLTTLYNRSYLNESLEREINRAERTHIAIAIIMIDLDYFKNINDTFGHQAGDLILQTMGKILLREVRKSDMACRYGGEEFILALYDTSLNDAISRAEHIRKKISETKFHFAKKTTTTITASFGIAIYPEHGQSMDELIRASDKALYHSKKSGRNKVTVYQKQT